MADKEQIKKIIKEYYSTDMIIREVTIEDHKGKQITRIFDQLASIKWNILKQNKDPDIERTEVILEKRRVIKAKQLFLIVQNALKTKDKEDEYNQIYPGGAPETTEPHTKLMDYCIGALYYLQILTPYEYEVEEPLFDEQGVLLANKLMPKDKEPLLQEDEYA